MKRSRLFSRLLLAFLAPVTVLLLLEFSCRQFHWGHPTRFLLSAVQHGQDVWIDNQIFGYRFFAPAVSRAPQPMVIPRVKAADEFRVVVLGESAAMGEPEPAYGPAHLLECQLEASLSNRAVRVINAAMTAINSHVILEIARDLERMQPDVVILYIGNNEVVGPYGPGTVFHGYAASPTLNRIRVLLTRLHLASAIRSWFFHHRGGDQTVWQGMEMFADRQVSIDDPRLGSVYESFRINLQDIVTLARKTGARVILNTIAVNLADQAPFDGSKPVPDDATLEDLKGLRDGDRLRFRADSRINRIIRDIAANDPSLMLVDAEQLFEMDGPPGYDAFIDHVHFDFNGSERIANIWAEKAGGGTPLSTEDMRQRLVWNPYNALDIAEVMLERAAKPPFTSTKDNKKRMLHWTRERATLVRATRQLPLNVVMDSFEEMYQRHNQDMNLAYQAARALMRENRFDAAIPWVARLKNQLSFRSDIRGMVVILSAASGHTGTAWDTMTERMPDTGELPADMLIGASETLLHAGLGSASSSLLETAADHYPNRMRLKVLLASRLAQIGMTDRAASKFKALVSEYPGETWIAEEYGILLAMSGRVAEATPLLEHLRDAKDAEGRLKWMQYLLFQKKIEDAIATAQAITQSHPEHGGALSLLARIGSQRNDLESAITWTEKWTDVEPWQAEAWGQLGNLYDASDRVGDAISAYEQAIPLLPDPSGTQRALAWLLATTDQGEQALEVMDDVMLLEHPPLGYTRLVRAAALASSGRHEEAIAEIDLALDDLTGAEDPSLAEQLKGARELFSQSGTIRR